MTKQFTLGKNERLKSRKQIEQLFSEGKKITVTPFRVFYLIHEPLPPAHHPNSNLDSKGGSHFPIAIGTPLTLQFGVGVSAKNFKRAVDRNRIKRLTKEAYRLQKKELKEKVVNTGKTLNLFFIYTGKELPDFLTVKDKVALALKKLEKIIDENSVANS